MGTVLARARNNATVVVALLIVGLFLALDLAGFSVLAAIVLFVGFPVVVPLTYLLFAERADPALPQEQSVEEGTEPSADASNGPTDEVERLREQYASGQITEVEFEERIEQYLDPEVDEDVPPDAAAIEAELERASNDR